MTREQLIAKIAHRELRIPTLEHRKSDRLDFHEVSVWSVESALNAAYEAGYAAAEPATFVTEASADANSDERGGDPPATAEPAIIEHHRNGVAGAPFNVVLFTDHGPHGSRKLGIVFEAAYHVAVFDLAKLAAGDIAFGSNSWRGDQFERMLRAMIAQHDAADR
jgi:hypothetical protein